MNMDDYWNYLLASLDVVGLVALRAVGQKKATGWLWAMFTQVVWVVYSLTTFQWGFLAVALVKLGVYTWNWLSWVRSDKAEAEAEVKAEEKTPEELALEVARAVLPPKTDDVTVMHAASMLFKAIKVVELYPEKMKTGQTA